MVQAHCSPDWAAAATAGAPALASSLKPAMVSRAHVAACHSPFIVLLKKQCANEADERVLVGEDLHNVGAPLDLTVQPLDGVGRAESGSNGFSGRVM